jgi:heat shock protein HslJ
VHLSKLLAGGRGAGRGLEPAGLANRLKGVKIIRVAVGSLLVGAILASCGEDRLPMANPFGKGTWRLAEAVVDGAALGLVATHPVTLRSDGDSVGGISACNHYGGRLRLSGGSVTIDEIFMTEMACLDEGVMEMESAYLDALGRVDAVSLEDDHLVLAGDGVTLRFVEMPPEPDSNLTGTTWILETLVVGESASTPAARAELRIGADGVVTGHTGCNALGARYDVDAGFSDVHRTAIGCEEPIMVQEDLIVAVLGSDPTLAIGGSLLTIELPDGRALVYRAATGE